MTGTKPKAADSSVSNVYPNAFHFETRKAFYLCRMDSPMKFYIPFRNAPVHATSICIMGDTIFFLGSERNQQSTYIGHIGMKGNFASLELSRGPDMLWEKRDIESIGVAGLAIYAYGDVAGKTLRFEKLVMRSGRWSKVPSLGCKALRPFACEYQHRVLYCCTNSKHVTTVYRAGIHKLDMTDEEAGWKAIMLDRLMCVYIMFQTSPGNIIMFSQKLRLLDAYTNKQRIWKGNRKFEYLSSRKPMFVHGHMFIPYMVGRILQYSFLTHKVSDPCFDFLGLNPIPRQ